VMWSCNTRGMHARVFVKYMLDVGLVEVEMKKTA